MWCVVALGGEPLFLGRLRNRKIRGFQAQSGKTGK